MRNTGRGKSSKIVRIFRISVGITQRESETDGTSGHRAERHARQRRSRDPPAVHRRRRGRLGDLDEAGAGLLLGVGDARLDGVDVRLALGNAPREAREDLGNLGNLRTSPHRKAIEHAAPRPN